MKEGMEDRKNNFLNERPETMKGDKSMGKIIKKVCSEHGEYTTTGSRGGCKKCKVEGKPDQTIIKKNTPKKAKAVKLPKPVVKIKEVKPNLSSNGNSITVDFSNYTELQVQLEQLALENFRTPELQILHVLDEVRKAGE